jgi:hypothetical protein
MKLNLVMTCFLAGIFSIIQLCMPASAIAMPLDRFSDVAHQVTQGFSETSPEISHVAGAMQDGWTGLVGKVEESKATVSKVSGKLSHAAVETGKQLSSTAVDYGRGLGSTTLETGAVLGGKALAAGSVVGETAKAAGSASLEAGNSALNSAVSLGHSTKDGAVLLIQQGAHTTSYAATELASLAAQAFKNDAEPFLMDALGEINLAALEFTIQTFKEHNPGLDTEALARKFINSKRSGSMTTRDWHVVATSLAEMIYEIAGVYGFPPQDLARKQEVLTITALGLGSAHTVSQGLELASFAAGFVMPSHMIEVSRGSSNAIAKAIMFWRVGEAACSYYASQLMNPISA